MGYGRRSTCCGTNIGNTDEKFWKESGLQLGIWYEDLQPQIDPSWETTSDETSRISLYHAPRKWTYSGIFWRNLWVSSKLVLIGFTINDPENVWIMRNRLYERTLLWLAITSISVSFIVEKLCQTHPFICYPDKVTWRFHCHREGFCISVLCRDNFVDYLIRSSKRYGQVCRWVSLIIITPI